VPDILVTDDGPVRIVRMNRPHKKNALTLAMYAAMAQAIEDAGSARALVIAGGADAFCAGNDINDFVHMTKTGALGAPILHFLHALARCETPLVAAVGGVAVGGGVTMLMHCDYVVAADHARLSTPFVSLGLVPEAASSMIGPRLMGQARAFSLLVMGKPLPAADAKAAGLVNAVVQASEVENAALTAARAIAALPAEGVRTARRLLRGAPDEIVRRIDEEAELFKQRLQSPEAKAAFKAFFDRSC
jgi:enoyl-CoA hydratase/carnithine racemase